MLRVVGDDLSFYSMRAQSDLIARMSDYRCKDEREEEGDEAESESELPVTSVLQLHIDERNVFNFTDDKHRDVILRMLSAISTNIA
jgi:hypothetical protein